MAPSQLYSPSDVTAPEPPQTRSRPDPEHTNSTLLPLGPPGTGNPLMAQTLARRLSVPYPIVDATTRPEAGYVGEDVENNILQLLHRSAVLASDIYARQARHEVELYIDLPMDQFDLFDVDPLDEIVEVGYQVTRELLSRTRLSEKIPAAPPAPGPPDRTSSGR